MESEIYMTPVYCRRALAGRAGRTEVRGFVEQARRALGRLLQSRRCRHQSWQSLQLSRTELLEVMEALEAGEGELHDVALSLSHLERFVMTGRRVEARRALDRWERAEKRHGEYRDLSLSIEPWMYERLNGR